MKINLEKIEKIALKEINRFQLCDKNSFREIINFDNGVYGIYQKYDLKAKENCFWEIHENFYDLNIWLEGIEKISIANTLAKIPGYFEKRNEDFWLTYKMHATKEDFILSSKNRILLIPPLTPHKCVQITDLEAQSKKITKITLKLPIDGNRL